MSRFLRRYHNELIPKWTTAMDRERHLADSAARYKHCFDLIQAKIAEYSIEPCHSYNLDEKGFLIGQIGRSKRIFSRQAWEQGRCRAPIQDGSREWITVMACICADGTALDPALIYQSDASLVQES